MEQFSHIPVLIDECIEGLAIRPEGIYVDATLGGGGHTTEISKRLTTGYVIGLDRDADAIANAERKFADNPCIRPVRSNFCNMSEALASVGVEKVDGVLFDLGVSSPQLDTPERGFSYMADAPLDMRMDRRESLTARDVVNEYPRERIEEILRDYGEERYARRISENIIYARSKAPIETTLELVDIIKHSMPGKALAEKQHPAKRSFQAIRIEVNGELAALRSGLEAALDVLKPGGRIAVISFHSLEDRIVKHTFADAAKGCTCPSDFPICVCGKTPDIKIINRSAITAKADELELNPRSRSAKLRIAEKIDK